jgi:N,N'-diacetylchitobiose transport system substrate-binding protein
MKTITLIVAMVFVLSVSPAYAGGQQESSATMELTVWSISGFSPDSPDPIMADYYERLKTEFEQQNNVKITWEAATGAMAENRAQLFARMREGRIADVNNIAAVWVPYLGEFDAIQPYVDEYAIKDIDKDFMPGPRLTHSYEGVQISIPFYVVSRYLLYRKDLFEQEGLDPPETWQDVRRVGKVMVEKGHGGLLFVAKPSNYPWIILSQHIRGLGGRYVSEDGSPALGEEATQNALIRTYTHYRDLMDIGVLDRAALTLSNEGELVPMILNNEISMWFTGDSGLNQLEIEPGWVREHVGAVPIPMPEGYYPVLETGGWGWSMKKQNDPARQKMAWQLVNYLVSSEKLAEFTTLRRRNMPPRPSAAAMVDFNDMFFHRESILALSAALDRSSAPLPVTSYTAAMEEEVPRGLESVLLGNLTPEEAARRVAEEVERAWRRTQQ